MDLRNLPGYDTNPDIYETPSTTTESTTTTAPLSPSSVSSSYSASTHTSDSESELQAGISRRRLFPARARQKFNAGETRGTTNVDLSDRVDGGRRGYKLRARGSSPESLEARVARLRREVEECRVLAGERTGEAEVEEAERSVSEGLEGLARVLRGIELRAAGSRPRGDVGRGQEDGEEEEEAVDERVLGRAAAFDSRLAALEQVLGISALDAIGEGEGIVAPVLPSLQLLDRQLSALTSATSLSNLEAASSKIQKLRQEAEKLSSTRSVPVNALPANDEENDNAAPATAFSEEDLSNLQHLYTLLPTLHSLSPTVPALLSRLRSLHILHSAAATAAQDLDAIEKRQREMDEELKVWREGLQKVEEAVREAGEANGRNGKFVEGWVRELEGRVGRLGMG